MTYGRNRQGKVFLVWRESVFRLPMASVNYNFQKNCVVLGGPGQSEAQDSNNMRHNTLLSMLNYSQLQLRATQSRIIAAQLLGAFNAWLQHIAEKPAVELQTFIEYEWVANFAQPGL